MKRMHIMLKKVAPSEVIIMISMVLGASLSVMVKVQCHRNAETWRP